MVKVGVPDTPGNDLTHWDPEAVRVHGIAREILVERGNTAQFVAEQLNFSLAAALFYTDGWGQDYVWMKLLMLPKSFPNSN